MRETWWLSMGTVLVFAISAALLWIWMQSQPDISHNSFTKIELGMSESQVEEIFHVPAGEYRSLEIPPPWPRAACPGGLKQIGLSLDQHGQSAGYWKVWRSDSVSIMLHFDEQGEVIRKSIVERTSPQQSLRDYLPW